MRVAHALLVTPLLMISGGCFVGKKPTVQVPVSAPVTPAPATPEPAVAKPAPVAPTPAPQPVTPAPANSAPVDQAKPSPFGTPPATTAKPKPITPTPVAPTPAPTLGTLLSADQRRQLDAGYQADVRQSNNVLAKLNGRTLTTAQTDTLNRARAFLRQAAQYHDRDLSTAAELARRAKVLTQDLATSLK